MRNFLAGVIVDLRATPGSATLNALLISCGAAGRKVQKVEAETPAGDDLRAEYQRRYHERRGARERWSRLEQHVADARLVVFSAGLMLAFFVYRMHWPSALWLIVPLVVFVALVMVHEPLRRRSGRAGRAMDFYAKGLTRMEDRWAGTGVSGLGFLDLNHPYAADLDLFGAGSLFERLCTARTRAGEDVLASWLLAPALPETLTERHEALTELRPRLDLREDLELLGSDVRSGIDPEALAAWGKAPRVFPGRGPRIAAAMLALLGSAAVIGWAFFELGVIPLLVVMAIEIAFALWLAERVRRVLAAVDERAHDLVLLGDLLDRLEREPSRSALLRRLTVSLETQGRPASVQIRRLARLVQLLDARKNQFFFPVAAVLLWKTQLAMAVDAWRGAEGPRHCRLVEGGRGVRGPLRAGGLCGREPGGPVPRNRHLGRSIRSRRPGAPLDPRGRVRAQRSEPGGFGTGPRRERVEHVRQEHAPAHGRRGCGHGPGRGAGAGPPAACLAAGGGGDLARSGLAPGRKITFLRRDHPGPPARRSGWWPAAAFVPL